MQKGKINVQTENIFPIIKKFLYSDHEIFLRELISNAVDATQKLKALSSMGEVKGELGDLTIEILLNKTDKTLTIRDKGIGMTSEEVEKYINQIAFSSAEDFVTKFKGKTDAETHAIIGHFGLGFYSAFMVSSQVEIFTKTYKKGPGTKAVSWTCDGSPDYELSEADHKDRGTDVVLHIAEDSEEFLEDSRILELLNKYCRFLPVPIQFGMKKHWTTVEGEVDEKGEPKEIETEVPRIINEVQPLWKQKPSELTDEEYDKFYHTLYPTSFEDPLFHIHLNVDYPFNLTGILYFPRVKKNIELQRNKIQLYCNQVFVTDSVEGIVPDFLTLLHGVIDSPDIPLNVSRSFLQSDSNVKKISSHITKKVADKLEEIFKNKREEFEKKWDDIRVFIEYGMITEEKFFERAEKFCLFKNSKNEYATFEEYKEKIKVNQTDKDGNLVYLYTHDPESQHTFLEACEEKGYDVLLMDGQLDNHFINSLESKFEKSSFKRIDAESIEKLINKDELSGAALSPEEESAVKPLFEEAIDKQKFTILFEALPADNQPITITQPEFMRRMKEMSAMGGGYAYMRDMPDQYNLVINTNHKAIQKVLHTEDAEEKAILAKQLTDLALLTQHLLKGEDLTKFVKRSLELL
ncbi:MAG: molecular chaperone HtpG [Bacteroidota bacterium]